MREYTEKGYPDLIHTYMRMYLYMFKKQLELSKGNDLATAFTDSVDKAFNEEMYLTPVTTADGKKEYYFNVHEPNLQPVSDFFTANRDFFKSMGTGEATCPGTAINIVGGNTTKQTLTMDEILTDPELLYYYLKAITLETSSGENSGDLMFEHDSKASEALTAVLGKVGELLSDETAKNYFLRLNHSCYYYLINGETNTAEPGKMGTQYGNKGIFGLANNGYTNAGSELKSVADGGKWTLEPVNTTSDNYFGMELTLQGRPEATIGSNERTQHYYGTGYLDFPIDITATNDGRGADSLVFYYPKSGVKEAKDAQGNVYHYIALKPYMDVVPAQAPFIMESLHGDAADNKLMPVVNSDAQYEGDDVFKGTLLPLGYPRTDNTDMGTKMQTMADKMFGLTDVVYNSQNSEESNSLVLTQMKNMKGFDVKKYAHLYTLFSNSKDEHNPMGFYFYGDKDADSDTNTNHFWEIPQNRAFILFGTDEKNTLAKIIIGSGEEETDGISNVPTSAQQEKDVIYDLSGRRVSAPRQGIYIVNGKKVLITK